MLCWSIYLSWGGSIAKEIAALVGVAPFNRDSGRYSGKRRIWGGRAEIRSLLYMATVVAIRYNPPLRAYYQHLREKGKLKKSCYRGLYAEATDLPQCHDARQYTLAR